MADLNLHVEVEDSSLQHLERVMSDVADEAQDLLKELGKVNDEIEDAKKAGKSYDHLEQKQQELLTKLTKTTGTLNKQKSTYDSLSRAGVGGFNKVTRAADKTEKELKDVDRQAGKLRGRFDKLTGTATDKLTGFNSQLGALATKAGPASIAVVAVGGSILATSAAITLGVIKLKEYSKELANLEKFAMLTGGSIQEVMETMRAIEIQGFEIDANTLFTTYKAAVDAAIADAESKEAKALIDIGLTPAASFGEIRDQILLIEDDFERMRIAGALFGDEAGAIIASLDGITQAEKDAVALRLANAEEVKATGETWRQIGQNVDDIFTNFMFRFADDFTALGERILPILDEIALWVMYSPAVDGFIDKITEMFDNIFGLLDLVTNVSPEEKAQWQALRDEQLTEIRTAQKIEREQRDAARLTSVTAAAIAQNADSTKTQSDALKAAMDSTDNKLKAILPTIECGAEAVWDFDKARKQPFTAMDFPEPKTPKTLVPGQEGFHGPTVTEAKEFQIKQGINPDTGERFVAELGSDELFKRAFKSISVDALMNPTAMFTGDVDLSENSKQLTDELGNRFIGLTKEVFNPMTYIRDAADLGEAAINQISNTHLNPVHTFNTVTNETFNNPVTNISPELPDWQDILRPFVEMVNNTDNSSRSETHIEEGDRNEVIVNYNDYRSSDSATVDGREIGDDISKALSDRYGR